MIVNFFWGMRETQIIENTAFVYRRFAGMKSQGEDSDAIRPPMHHAAQRCPSSQETK
ncbi:hypothetical protein [Sphingomonas jinjuensis]|uniref:hypothetical protein n=1 Tax=Sphingomonas jinjuensis TaxID=535907 RepID=UPI001FE5574F|nr:hypothetical protein [Sphingomonas jinjuensis]